MLPQPTKQNKIIKTFDLLDTDSIYPTFRMNKVSENKFVKRDDKKKLNLEITDYGLNS